jgi:hypothetical protein
MIDSFIIKKNIFLEQIPPTPLKINSETICIESAQKALLVEGRKYGHPISFVQEQNGALIQNIFPVYKNECQQISTSSKVELHLHTETAFHPYKPDYVLLLCLRGDSNAHTTHATIDDIIKQLDKDTIDILMQDEFLTGVDDSFSNGQKNNIEFKTSILKYNNYTKEYSITYDSYSMRGITLFASHALDQIKKAIYNSVKEVCLESGDIMVINNNKVIHGRKSFQPRYDGTDRWLQRMLIRKKLPPKEQMNGHIVMTDFAEFEKQ